MPANLTQQYLNADARYRAATTDEEKLDALQEMLREIPKHKGTDHMQADIKRKISQLKKQAGKKSATGVRRKNEFHVSKEGAGQVVIVGPPNSGKSALAGALSTAEPEVADYPFTTHRPQPCMGLFENVQIQLVDTAPIAEDYLEPWLPGLVRNADLVSLVLDLSSDDLLDHYEICLRRLEESKLALIADPAQRFGEEGVANKKTHLVGAKSDAPNAADNLEILTEIVDGRFEIIPVSIHRRETLDAWMRRLFDWLGIIRVYAKQRGKDVSKDDPVILPVGATVADFARTIHKDFAEKMKFAKIWGEGKFDGQMVNRDYALSDEDVVEMHM